MMIALPSSDPALSVDALAPWAESESTDRVSMRRVTWLAVDRLWRTTTVATRRENRRIRTLDTTDHMTDLDRAVQTVVNDCLGVRAGEHVVLVVDRTTRALGDVLRDAAAAAGGEAVLAVMDPREEHGQEPPQPVAAALAAADVFIAPTTKSLSHTRARKAASDGGARGATLPGVNEDMLARLMACDFPTLQRRSGELAQLLTEAEEVRITCPRGTHLALDLRGRDGIADDGDLTRQRAFGNLPCGEGFIAPLHAQGRMVTHCLAGIGLPRGDPPVLTIEDGRLVDATEPEGEGLLAALRAAGELGTNVAELGIGTNEKATLTGNILEDEKILGTVHVAFGASAAIGGSVSVPVHLDCMILEPTLEIGGTRVLDNGDFLL
jgi:leucyl aminopeptidase (aminopeptidase T)